MAKKKSQGLTLKDLIAAQQKLAAKGDDKAKQQIERLQAMAATPEAAPATPVVEPESTPVLETLNRLEMETRKGLIDKQGEGVNANILKVNDNIIKLRQTIEKFQQKQQTPTPPPAPPTAKASPTTDTAAVREQQKEALAERSQQSAGKYVPGALDFNIKGALKLENIFDLSEGKSTGLLGRAVRRKVAQNEYVENQMAVNPNMANLKQFGGDQTKVQQFLKKQFDEQQTIRKQQSINETKIQKLETAGYTERQVSQAGLEKARRELDQQLAAKDPNYRRQQQEAQATQATAKQPTVQSRQATPTSPAAVAPRATKPVNLVTPADREQQKQALAERSQQSAGKYVPGALDFLGNAKNAFKLENIFDLSEGKSQGILGRAVRRKVAKNEYIENQMAVNPNMANLKQFGGDQKAVKTFLGKQFEEQQAVRKQQAATEQQVTKLEQAGYTEKQVGRAGLFKKRRELDEQLAKKDPNYRRQRNEDVSSALPITAAIPVTAASAGAVDVTPAQQPAAAIRRTLPGLFGAPQKVTTLQGQPVAPVTGGSLEKEEENLRLMNEQNQVLKKIEENTRPSKPTKEKQQQPEKENESEGGGLLGGLRDLLGMRKAGTAVAKPGAKAAATRFGARALGVAGTAASYALPAAAMLGAVNVVDYGLGKAGVGVDEKGNDIQINTKQDEANWNRMSWLQKAESGIGRGIEKTGSFLGLDNISREAQAKRIETETAYLDKTQPATKAPVTKSEVLIANRPVKDRLTIEQMAAVELGTMNGNKYPPDVMKKYNAQKAEQAKPSAPPPTSADNVYNKSNENAAAAAKPKSAPTVVNAPTNTNIQQTQQNIVKSPPRNTESTYRDYERSRYAW